MESITSYVKLVAKHTDSFNYTTYVFENFDTTNYTNKYIMCVQFPNWEQDVININDEGYVHFRFVQAGIDKWYNGSDFNTYRYTNYIFIKFVLKKEPITNIILD